MKSRQKHCPVISEACIFCQELNAWKINSFNV